MIIQYEVINPASGEIAAMFPSHDLQLAFQLCDKLAEDTGETWEVRKMERIYQRLGAKAREAMGIEPYSPINSPSPRELLDKEK
jgi:predicted ArsR family transcriptional regulator